jgi:O-antigen polymerase
LNFSFYAIDPRIIGFLLTSLFALLILWGKKTQLSSVFLNKVLLLAIGYLSLSAFWSVGNDKYVQISFYLLLFSLFLLIQTNLKKLKDFYKLVFFLISLSLPAILISYYQIFSGLFYEYADVDIHRVSGPFDSPNLLGSLLLLTSSLSLILFLYFKKIKEKKYNLFLLTYLFLSLPIFITTFSRSAWLGLVIFLGIFSLQKRKLFIIIILLFSILLSTMLTLEPTRERLAGFSEHTMFDSMYARKDIWRMSYKKFLAKPFLGYGAGSFATVINDAKESHNGTENPHNDLVFFSLEGGLMGLIAYLIIVLSFYYYTLRYHYQLHKLSKKQSGIFPSIFIISWGILALLIAFSMISIVESYYEANFLHLFTWSLLAGWLTIVPLKIKKLNSKN